jgi:hypothetical protein
MKVKVVEGKVDEVYDLVDMPKHRYGVVINCCYPEYIGTVVKHLGGNNFIREHLMVTLVMETMMYDVTRGNVAVRLLPPNSTITITT